MEGITETTTSASKVRAVCACSHDGARIEVQLQQLIYPTSCCLFLVIMPLIYITKKVIFLFAFCFRTKNRVHIYYQTRIQ
jgi:hypothetical protein